jgi:hypothetical protein
MKLTLHVGLRKTATTTIQRMLWEARPLLAAEGVLCPGIAADHQRLARTLRSAEAGVVGKAELAKGTLDLLADEVRQLRPRHLVLSSEHLIALPAGAVRRLREMLAAALPDVTETRVLCYVREPIGLATSLCQQELKNGAVRLADYHARPWRMPLAEWLRAYLDSFGREALALRRFHPEHLKDGDILRDMLDALGVPDLPVPVSVPRRNRSLSQDGALVADALAGLRPGRRRPMHLRAAYRRMLEKIEGERFALPMEVQARVVEASRADLEMIRTTFGLEITPEPVPGPTATALTPDLALRMAENIATIVEG